jgi:hypothetical protein
MAGVKIVGRWTFYSVENRTSNTVVDRYAVVDGWCPLMAAMDKGSREVAGVFGLVVEVVPLSRQM